MLNEKWLKMQVKSEKCFTVPLQFCMMSYLLLGFNLEVEFRWHLFHQ